MSKARVRSHNASTSLSWAGKSTLGSTFSIAIERSLHVTEEAPASRQHEHVNAGKRMTNEDSALDVRRFPPTLIATTKRRDHYNRT